MSALEGHPPLPVGLLGAFGRDGGQGHAEVELGQGDVDAEIGEALDVLLHLDDQPAGPRRSGAGAWGGGRTTVGQPPISESCAAAMIAVASSGNRYPAFTDVCAAMRTLPT